MRKPKTRTERIDFIQRKLEKHDQKIFVSMTDREVKRYFDQIYPLIKDKTDMVSADVTVQCLRCSYDVEHHLECGCGIDRCVFSEDQWKNDIESENISDLTERDQEFIKNNYQVPD